MREVFGGDKAVSEESVAVALGGDPPPECFDAGPGELGVIGATVIGPDPGHDITDPYRSVSIKSVKVWSYGSWF